MAKSKPKPAPPGPKSLQTAEPGSPPFGNYAGDVPLTIDAVCESVMAVTGGWPKPVAGALVYPAGGEVRVLEDAAALFAWIAGYVPVDWRRGPRAVTKEELFKRLHQRQHWAWADAHPHFPPIAGVLYLTDPPAPKNNGTLDELVDMFRPQTDVDRRLIKALVLTMFWGGEPGKRPQFVIEADEGGDADAGRGTGKTVLPEYLSELVGGCVDVDPTGDRGRLASDLLSPAAWGRRVALVDNLKATRYSCDFLEKLITRTEITGHVLFRGFGRRPNFLTWVVTVNGASFSTDMAKRSVVIRLVRPKAIPADWDAKVLGFIRKNRERIVADVRWHLEAKKAKPLKRVDRWRSWCLAVLSKLSKPDAILREIEDRRAGIDADKRELAAAADHLRACLAAYFAGSGCQSFDPDRAVVWAPSAWFVQALRGFRRDSTDRGLEHLLSRLRGTGLVVEARSKSRRGYRWAGADVDPDDPPPPSVIPYQPDLPGKKR